MKAWAERLPVTSWRYGLKGRGAGIVDYKGNEVSCSTVTDLCTIPGSNVVAVAIFCGVGIACLPLGLIFSFIRRPKAVITRSQYIKEATELGKKARELKKAADVLHQEETTLLALVKLCNFFIPC
uniref:Uncharacterized protein n=1 Tax=Salix viminalis TaxID=40686 RepID=A0A6N2N289_SALVM